MKRWLAFALVLAMLFSLAVPGFAEGAETPETDPSDAEVDLQLGEENLSGQMFSEIFGDGSDYQVVGIELADDLQSAVVSYIAAEDCVLRLRAVEESSSRELLVIDTPVPAGSESVTVALDASVLPEHFWVEAVLLSGGRECSEVYVCNDRTKAYEDFLNTRADDEAFQGCEVLDFGVGSDGSENFAVLREDVKVVYVDSMDDVEVLGDSGEAALFGLVEQNEGFVFSEVENDEVLQDLASGDKLLILPRDNASDARVFFVEDVEEVAVLFADGEMGSGYEVTASQEGSDLGDFFDFIRVNVEVEADAGDIDTSDADEDVVFSDDPVVYEPEDGDLEADLFDSKTSSASHTVSLTAEVSAWVKAKGGNASAKAKVSVKDTVSLTAKVSLSINYKSIAKVPTKLTSVVAKSEITAKNVFNVNVTAGAEYKMNPKKLGTIPIGTVAGVTFSVPVYLTFSASFDGEFDYTATNTSTSTTKVTYKSGKVYSEVKKSASATKELKTEAKVTITLGIKATLEISFLKVITANLSAEVGLMVTGRLQSLNTTTTYRHSAKACLTVELDLYVIPSFNLKLVKKELAKKTWSTSKVRLFTFHAHESLTGSWSYGVGECPQREYLNTLSVTDSAGKPMSNVTVKEGSKTLGKTNSSGQLKVWLSMATHTLKFEKANYTTGTLKFTVTGAKTQTIALYKGGANETYFTMSDLLGFTDEDWELFMSDPEDVSNTIFRIETAEDFAMLPAFAARNDRTTEGLRFVLNNASGTIDLSAAAWTPIGSAERPFRGELDGNGFTITGLTVNGGAYAGLFGCTEGALIHDLTLENVNIRGGDYTGALVGKAGTDSNLYDIGVSGSVSGGSFTGGVVGALECGKLLNAYSLAKVSGQNAVGGIAGSLTCTEEAGLIANCYHAGTLSGSAVGGVCGTTVFAAAPTLAEDDDAVTAETGIRCAYYLDSTAETAVANGDGAVAAITFAVNAEQLNGTNTTDYITEDEGCANALTLLEALNNWYALNGSYNAENEVETEEGETIPESSPNDYYNKWYADTLTEEGEGGYPIFAQKEPAYALTVYYVYEDGTEAFPSVTLYLTEGQPYDVDSYKLEGYHTYELEYKGEMPAYDLEYRVIYIADAPYTTMTQLAAAEEDAKAGETFSIASEEELILFSSYVNGGRNTRGVTFVQLEPIELADDSAFVPAGSSDEPFCGTFEGAFLGISNLKHSLFGTIDGATINAVVLDSAAYTDLGDWLGGVAAYAINSKISSCVVTAAISGRSSAAGGIVGKAEISVIDQCAVSGSINISGSAGGIVGLLDDSDITNCSNTAAVTGTTRVGGLAGEVSNYATLENSYSNAAVTGTSMVGGLIGKADSCTLKNLYQHGTVTGGDALIGKADSFELEVESVWYPQSGASTLSEAAAYAEDEAGTAALLDSLNAWVTKENSGKYYAWSASVREDEADETDEVITPVFGTLYTNWLLDFTMDNGLSYTYAEDFFEGAATYIAVYDESGRMLLLMEITESAKNAPAPEGAAYAKAFILAEDGEPLSAALLSSTD